MEENQPQAPGPDYLIFPAILNFLSGYKIIAKIIRYRMYTLCEVKTLCTLET